MPKQKLTFKPLKNGDYYAAHFQGLAFPVIEERVLLSDLAKTSKVFAIMQLCSSFRLVIDNKIFIMFTNKYHHKILRYDE